MRDEAQVPYREAPCVHCGAPGSTDPCPCCRRLVCASCAAGQRWPTAPRLGWRARVLDVDEQGRYALFANWQRVARLYDIARAATCRFPGIYLKVRQRLSAQQRRPLSCLLPDGMFVNVAHTNSHEIERDSTVLFPTSFSIEDMALYKGLRVRRPDLWVAREIALSGGPRTADVRSVTACAGAAAALVVRDNSVDVFNLEAGYHHGTVRLGEAPVQLAAAAPLADRLAACSLQQLGLYSYGALEPVGKPLILDRRLVWLGMAGSRLIRVCVAGEIRVHNLDGPGDWRHSVPVAQVDRAGVRGPGDVSANSDGRLVALRRADDALVVCAAGHPTQQVLGPVRAGLDLVRFVSEERLFVATANSRLVTWRAQGDRVVSVRSG